MIIFAEVPAEDIRIFRYDTAQFMGKTPFTAATISRCIFMSSSALNSPSTSSRTASQDSDHDSKIRSNHHRLFSALKRQHQYEKCIQLGLEMTCHSPEMWFHIAYMYEMGFSGAARTQESIWAYERCFRLSDKFVSLLPSEELLRPHSQEALYTYFSTQVSLQASQQGNERNPYQGISGASAHNIGILMDKSKQFELARIWYLNACQLFFVDSFYNLAVLMRNGCGGVQDVRLAKLLYRICLELDPNHTAAMNNLAALMECEKDLASAQKLYERAATLGSHFAMHNLASLLLAQNRVTELSSQLECCLLSPDEVCATLEQQSSDASMLHLEESCALLFRATKLLKTAADAKHWRSSRLYAELLTQFHTPSSSQSTQILSLALHYLVQSCTQQIEQQAEDGFSWDDLSESMSQIAHWISCDLECSAIDWRDAVRVFDYFLLNHETPVHVFNLGVILTECKDPDPVTTRDAHRRACDLYTRIITRHGFTAAYNNLGRMYYYGHGGKRNLSKAFACFLMGSNAGHGDAMNALALCYQNNHGVPAHENQSEEYRIQQAALWFRRASERGDSLASYNLGKLLQFNLKDVHNALLYYQQSHHPHAARRAQYLLSKITIIGNV